MKVNDVLTSDYFKDMTRDVLMKAIGLVLFSGFLEAAAWEKRQVTEFNMSVVSKVIVDSNANKLRGKLNVLTASLRFLIAFCVEAINLPRTAFTFEHTAPLRRRCMESALPNAGQISLY